MKKTIALTAFILLISALPLFAQNWNAVDFPLEESISGVNFLDLDTVFLITNQGKLVRSFDNLKTFDIFEPTSGTPLEDVHFINSTKGFICGPKGTFKVTNDGGYTFEDINITDSLPWFFDVEMFDTKHGMVIGMTRDSIAPLTGIAFRTEDGGKTWKKLKKMGLGYSEIFFQSGKVYLLSFGRINISDDFGKTWSSKLTIDGSPGRSLSFYGNSGIIAGLSGMCAYTNDGGNVWLPSAQDPQKIFIACEMVSINDGYIGGTRATLMKTTDGGKSWNQELMAKSFDIYDMALIKNRIYVLGANGGIIWKNVK